MSTVSLRLLRFIERLHAQRPWHVAVAVFRILLGFAFVPAGLKKLLAQPFTASHLHGPFHDFLHAFVATGWFYRAVGVLQLLTAALYFAQHWSAPLVALPILTTIVLFTWSTSVPITASVASAMWLATVAVLLWERPAWCPGTTSGPPPPYLSLRLWQLAGAAVVLSYGGLCVATGTVYRPQPSGADHGGMLIMALLPVWPLLAWWFDRRAWRLHKN